MKRIHTFQCPHPDCNRLLVLGHDCFVTIGCDKCKREVKKKDLKRIYARDRYARGIFKEFFFGCGGEEKANDSKTCQGAGCDVCEDCEQAQLGKYESLQERIAENAGMNEDSMHDGDEDCFL